jgi:ATP-dependent RNA helicase RhlE
VRFSRLGSLNLPRIAQEGAHNIVSFADLGVSKSVLRALSRRDITQPFPVQQMVIRDALAAHDLLVQSPTGSGKTLAFGIPLVERIEPGQGLAALVLAPTRELASQIVDELDSIGAARRLRVAAVYGGVGFGPQIKRAAAAEIVVATPGRLEDLIARGSISLKRVRILVLDEADRMLDMGFKPAVSRIVAQTPAERQTLFFSATLEGATGKLAAAYTRKPRSHTQAAAERSGEAEVEHRFVHVDSQSAKIDHLAGQLRDFEGERTLVFVRTKRGADRLVKRLRSRELDAVAMHGDKSQGQRERALARFERGDVNVLVATDVAARGIDVADIAHVVNFDAPGDRDSYVHRVGRTGRAGARGAGTSFVLADQAGEMRRIAHDLGLGGEFDRGLGHAAHVMAPSKQNPPSKAGNRRRRRRRRVPA